MKRWFVTGTDTEIGKTRVTCALLRHLAGAGYRAAGVKPVAAGCERTADGLRNEDALALMAASNVALDYGTVNPVALEPAIAPHIAAERAGTRIDLERIVGAFRGIEADYLLVEGAGGWCVPLGDGLMTADLARRVADAVILVVGMRLGCINHALLSAQQIRRDGASLIGWVANRIDPDMPAFDDNLRTLVAAMPVPLMAMLPWNPRPDGLQVKSVIPV